MKIRKAKPEDCAAIAEVLTANYNMNKLSEGEAAFKHEVDNGYHYIVAEDNGKIVKAEQWTS